MRFCIPPFHRHNQEQFKDNTTLINEQTHAQRRLPSRPSLNPSDWPQRRTRSKSQQTRKPLQCLPSINIRPHGWHVSIAPWRRIRTAISEIFVPVAEKPGLPRYPHSLEAVRLGLCVLCLLFVILPFSACLNGYSKSPSSPPPFWIWYVTCVMNSESDRLLVNWWIFCHRVTFTFD